MNEFTKLRERAREKRDRLIASTKREYEATLVQIAALEQDLLGRESSRHQKLSACIESAIPSDRPFTVADIHTALEARDPGRVWRKRSIDNHLSRLRAKGLVRRLQKSKGPMPAQYVRAGVTVQEGPFGDMTLRQVIAAVLTHPMTQTEIVVRMLEAGYETTMKRGALRNAVGTELRKGGFKADAVGKWSR